MEKENLFIRVVLFFNVASYAMVKNSPFNYLVSYQQKSVGMAFVFLFEFVVAYFCVIVRLQSTFFIFKLLFLSLIAYHALASFIFSRQIERMASNYPMYYNKAASFIFAILMLFGLVGFVFIWF
ncbi:hypothetical protein HQ865_22725 [Mucilaginibacter mali]|uniref:Uncharacterized protein n=1 Tax=Mucilaginibacter mali TaxID=2740462 RepID=A0A7D4TZR4_9SPHI|nr:hypothetical protein [Mucilaginibacter mali]QKJ32457.1 hypothetical protein HQ865_22725 [Mucilaginibacter mali]